MSNIGIDLCTMPEIQLFKDAHDNRWLNKESNPIIRQKSVMSINMRGNTLLQVI